VHSDKAALWRAAERVLETLRELDEAAVSCFRPAARKLLEEVGDAEKSVAMALARVTGFSAVKVGGWRDILWSALSYPVPPL
jgi:hypothetical protein